MTASLTARGCGAGGCAADPGPALGPVEAQRLADDIAMLAHPVRMQILSVLARHSGHVCVCDLESAVPVKQPTVSHHIRILRDAGLVHLERDGQRAYYLVDRRRFDALRERITAGLGALG